MDNLPETNPADLGESIVLQNPQGELETVSKAEAGRAIQEGGYTEANPAAILHADNEAKYGTPTQKAIGFGEQALSAATLHGSDVLATSLGITTPEAQAGRKEALGTGLGMAAQATGLIGSSLLLPGEGAVGLLGKAGDAAVDLAGLGETTGTAAKIGSAALKSAAENATFEATHQGAEFLQGNPDQQFGTALADIGLSAAIGAPFGAGFGAINPLWKLGSSTKLGQALKAITDKMGGVEGEALSATKDVADRAGVSLSPEAKSVIAKDPYLQDLAQPLLDSQTGSGKAFQTAIEETRSNLGNAVLESVGKTPEDISALADFSANEAGAKVTDKLADQVSARYEPIEKLYDEVTDKFKTVDFNVSDRAVLADQLARASSEEGWVLRPSSPEATFLNKAMKEVGVIDNLEKLRQFGSSLSKEAAAMGRWDIQKGITGLFNNTEEQFLRLKMAGEAPELLSKFESANKQYKEIKSIISELNNRLHVGASGGVKSFLYNLENKITSENILNRLAQKKDASFIEFLNKNFPEVQQSVNDFQLNKILKASSTKMGSSEAINPTRFFKEIQKLSPELRNSLIPAESQARLGAVSELWEGLNNVPKNYSGTAGTLARLMNKMPASAGAMVSMLLGHSPITGAIEGHVAELLGRNAPDAVRLGLIKLLGSSKEINSEGFKTAVQMIEHTIRGENLLGKASKAVFKSGQVVLPESAMPTEKDRNQLDRVLKSYQQNPAAMLNIGGALGHYSPEHAMAHGSHASNAVNVLNAMRPSTIQNSPLDKPMPPSKAQKMEFDRVLDVAEKPLIVLQHVKEGTLLPKDVAVVTAVHPELYHLMIDKLTADMTDHLSDGGEIPYKTRMGLSLLAGRPLDSTMAPQSIQATQMSLQSNMQKPSEVQNKVSLNAFKNIAENEKTQGQKAAQN